MAASELTKKQRWIFSLAAEAVRPSQYNNHVANLPTTEISIGQIPRGCNRTIESVTRRPKRLGLKSPAQCTQARQGGLSRLQAASLI
jgi:hypothetical protein